MDYTLSENKEVIKKLRYLVKKKKITYPYILLVVLCLWGFPMEIVFCNISYGILPAVFEKIKHQ